MDLWQKSAGFATSLYWYNKYSKKEIRPSKLTSTSSLNSYITVKSTKPGWRSEEKESRKRNKPAFS